VARQAAAWVRWERMRAHFSLLFSLLMWNADFVIVVVVVVVVVS
jgi:hypothetical protein